MSEKKELGQLGENGPQSNLEQQDISSNTNEQLTGKPGSAKAEDSSEGLDFDSVSLDTEDDNVIYSGRSDLFEDDEQDEEMPDIQPERERAKKLKKRKNGCLTTMIYIFVIFIISSLLAGAMLYGFNDIFAISKPDKKIVVYIEQGSSTKDIARTLKENKVVNSAMLYRLYSKLSKSDGNYQYGEYYLNSNMSYEEIASQLKKIAPKRNEVRITFKEGISANEILDLLVEKVQCDRQRLINALNEEEYKYDFVKAIPQNKNRYLRLEGYLFPDTYDFFVGEPEQSVIDRFLKNFQSKWSEEFNQRAKELGMSMDEVITLASIIQSEAGDPNEMLKVSGVFHNRLRRPDLYPKLQSCATRDYCENFIMPYLTTGDRQRYNLYYNTYKCDGLPAGPISNPGIDAIKAALYPEDVEYYFFVCDKNGKFYYSKTFAEHNKNISIAQSVK